ncbi:hypothetical protein PFISCL1PPCAC_24022, partial [Pristionchus fissidentatus]
TSTTSIAPPKEIIDYYFSTKKREVDMAPPAIGIDLGTTFSAVCFVDRGEVKVIHNNAGNEITPSVVHFDDSIVLVGEEALKKRKEGGRNTITNIKRLIGRDHDDPQLRQRSWPFEILRGRNNRVSVRIDADSYSPEEISAFILKYLKFIANKYFGEEPIDAVITVPSNFTNVQRQATKDAGEIAGFNVLQIVNEPTAAAIAFCTMEENEEKRRILVYDLGGGTFDVSIVEIEGRNAKVLATDGLTFLGGADFDRLIYEEAKTRFKEMGINIGLNDWALMDACEKAKKALTKRNSARINHVRHGNVGFDLTYDTFVELCDNLFELTIALTEKALADADTEEEDISEIVLVGGSTRIRRVRELLSKRFPNTRIRDDVEPDLAVAQGAAILASTLSNKPASTGPEETKKEEPVTKPAGVSLVDVTPLSLGLKMDGNKTSFLIPKNTRCPCESFQLYSNVLDNETSLTFEIVEGEYEDSSKNNALAKFEIAVSPKPKGKNLIKVFFSIDVNGILSVRAIDTHTKHNVSIIVTSEKLDEMERMRMTEQLSKIV